MDLRQKLSRHDYDPQKLVTAHARVNHKELADIISIVKHAGSEQSPLLNAEERVSVALAKVMSGKSFTPEQQTMLESIRRHLVESLSLDLDDFNLIPIFADRGGLTRASLIFPNLPQMVEEINYALAA